MFPYGKQSINEDDVAAVVGVLRSDWLTTGPAVDQFEAAIARRAGVPYAVSATSGTGALHMAYFAAGIKPGDEVITTPLTFVATAATAATLGAKIVFADVDPGTGNLDPLEVEALITPRTRAICAVDYAGVPVESPAFRALAKANDLVFVEDTAHSIGSTCNGQPVGSLSDITCFSFFPTKNLTIAEGGAVVTASADFADRARKFPITGWCATRWKCDPQTRARGIKRCMNLG